MPFSPILTAKQNLALCESELPASHSLRFPRNFREIKGQEDLPAQSFGIFSLVASDSVFS
jgi:hypothetical protein